nr:uncharacterized protein LOC127293101 isoform X1 [Lolium perenne]
MQEPPAAGRTPRLEAAAACSARRAMGRLDAPAAMEGSAERRGRLDAAAVEAWSVPERGVVVDGWCPVYPSLVLRSEVVSIHMLPGLPAVPLIFLPIKIVPIGREGLLLEGKQDRSGMGHGRRVDIIVPSTCAPP